MSTPTPGSQPAADDRAATQSDNPSTRVVTAVADAAGVAPCDLPPLYDAVDPDALDALFATAPSRPQPRGRVVFEYATHTVAVSATGTITVDPDTDAAAGDADPDAATFSA